MVHRLGRLDEALDELDRADEVAAIEGLEIASPSRCQPRSSARRASISESLNRRHRSRLCWHDSDGDAMTGSTPTLWQIDISHFSEKARWALAYKEVEHDRHAPPRRGSTSRLRSGSPAAPTRPSPCSSWTGARIGDSTAIIAALEQRYPELPLYPADPAERRRALELEDFFDEELGPNIRLLAFHELGNDPSASRK